MTYIICEPRIDVKDNAYIAVCPVEGIYPMPDEEPENDIPLGWTHTIKRRTKNDLRNLRTMH